MLALGVGWQAFLLASYNYPTLTPPVVYKKPTTEERIRKMFPEDPDTMVAISKCESGMRQFDEHDNPIVSHTHDYGLMQINRKTWDETARKMGLDYKMDLKDNLRMARHVYDVQGPTAWVCYHKMVYNYTLN